MTVVTNTSPLIALERIGQLSLLPKLYGTVIRPNAVLVEIEEGRGKYGVPDGLQDPDWLETMGDPPEMELRRELGSGETAVIALALRLQADLVILDDLAARNVAAELGLSVSGTLGILLAASRRGLLADVEMAVDALTMVGFRVSDRIVKEIRRVAQCAQTDTGHP